MIRNGKTGWNQENTHVIEYRLKLDSNPEFTSSVIVCCARAAFRMKQEGMSGCKTILDIPPAYLSAKSGEELRKNLPVIIKEPLKAAKELPLINHISALCPQPTDTGGSINCHAFRKDCKRDPCMRICRGRRYDT